MPYPVILGGDHAAYEAEHAGVPDRERPDWPLPSFDAKDWAEAFCKSFKVMKRDGDWKDKLAHDPDDEGLMISWFANALMRGFDERAAKDSQQAGTEAREFIAAWMIERGYATGHGETVSDLLTELAGHAKDIGRREAAR